MTAMSVGCFHFAAVAHMAILKRPASLQAECGLKISLWSIYGVDKKGAEFLPDINGSDLC
jgi:hypothetical protein